ncbi:unnamed protein product [Cunninghamella blakesleeana]
MALDVSPINTIQRTEYKISHSTPIRQEFQTKNNTNNNNNNSNNNTTSSSDTSSPIKFSPIVPLSSKEINHQSNKSSASSSERSQQRFNFEKDLHYKKSPVTERYQKRFSFDKNLHDNYKKSPIAMATTKSSSPLSSSERSQQRFSFDNDRDYTFNRSTLTRSKISPIKKMFNDEKDNEDEIVKEDNQNNKDDNEITRVNEKSNNGDVDEDDSLSFLQKSYSERIKKSTPSTTATSTNAFSRFNFQFSPNKQENTDDDHTFKYTKLSMSGSPSSHHQSSPQRYRSSPQRYRSSPQRYRSSPQRYQSSPKKQLASTYRSPVYSNSSYKSADKKESPIKSNQKPATPNNNTDDTIKQPSPSSFFMKSPFISSIKSDNIIDSNIRSPYTSRALYNINNNDSNDRSEDDDNKNDNDTKDNNENDDNNDSNNNSNNDQQEKKNSKTNSQLSTNTSISSVSNNIIKNDHHSEMAIYTQTSSQDSVISNRSSKRRYKYVKVGLPHYMLPTESFQHHVQSTSENNTKLHRTISRGVTKKNTPNLSRFKSSTRINAIDDIRKEMLPDDVYIPLAARIKLFEKGLGNGIKPTPIIDQKQTKITNPNGTPRLTKAKSPILLTRERSLTHHCYRKDESSSSSVRPSSLPPLENKDSTKNAKLTNQRKHAEYGTYTIDRDYRATKRSFSSLSSSTSTSNKNDHQVKKNETKRQKRFDHPPLEVKPFQFATDKRAARYQELFRAKLRLWKDKEIEEVPSQKQHK